MIFRYTTLQEANIYLPFIKDAFSKIHTLAIEGQILHNLIEKPSGENDKKTNPLFDISFCSAAPMASIKEKNYAERIAEIEEIIKKEIITLQKYNVVVKSLFPPRVEFISERMGHPIYLSWQNGESKVCHWHMIEEEFEHRRPIEFDDFQENRTIH